MQHRYQNQTNSWKNTKKHAQNGEKCSLHARKAIHGKQLCSHISMIFTIAWAMNLKMQYGCFIYFGPTLTMLKSEHNFMYKKISVHLKSYQLTCFCRVHQPAEFSVELEILDKSVAAMSDGNDEHMWMRMTDANIFSPLLSELTISKKNIITRYGVEIDINLSLCQFEEIEKYASSTTEKYVLFHYISRLLDDTRPLSTFQNLLQHHKASTALCPHLFMLFQRVHYYQSQLELLVLNCLCLKQQAI